MEGIATHQRHFGVLIPRGAQLERRVLQFDFLFENLNNVEDEQLKKDIPFAQITNAVKDATDPRKLLIEFKGNRPYEITCQSREDREDLYDCVMLVLRERKKGSDSNYDVIEDDVRTTRMPHTRMRARMRVMCSAHMRACARAVHAWAICLCAQSCVHGMRRACVRACIMRQ